MRDEKFMAVFISAMLHYELYKENIDGNFGDPSANYALFSSFFEMSIDIVKEDPVMKELYLLCKSKIKEQQKKV